MGWVLLGVMSMPFPKCPGGIIQVCSFLPKSPPSVIIIMVVGIGEGGGSRWLQHVARLSQRENVPF